MQISEFDISTAEGIILLNDIRIDEQVLPQGHKLTRDDILFLKVLGIKKITGVRTVPGDITSNTALGMIAPQICGNNIVYALSKTSNSCKLVADCDGIFICSDDRLSKFNRISPYLILNTVTPYKNIKKGDVIGSIKLRCPIIEQTFVDDIIFRLSGNEPLLKIEAEKPITAAIVYTRFYNDASENKHFTNIVKRLIKNFSNLNLNFAAELSSAHEYTDTAAAISEAAAKYPLVFVIPGLPSSYIGDTVPAALNASADAIVCDNIPQDTLPDLMIATKKNSKIIVLPYHYDKVSSPLADKFIKMAITKDKIFQTDFPNHNNIRLDDTKLTDEERDNIISPEDNIKKAKNDAHIAAVILAAGCSTRARRNKLMVDLGGEPLFMKAVRAAIKSKASPIYVVTGYRAEELEERLENLDINVLRNNDYASGVKTSIRLGLNSVPSFCDGTLLIPADMPCLTPAYINKMIKSFDRNNHRQLCVSIFEGKKYNPVIWGKDLYQQADLVPENSHLRGVFLEHSDYTKLVEADENACVDINFPYDIEILTNK
uniref:4-diphosphocytidyl-2C-methyl-D-erythritol kinase n=1 Tax=uncultured Alphaproteobacteria bacterium TaxID=91750 RepID=A0A6G8F3Q3_9PROT|nr:4-diphosphocytidyl-2C-methyl-D-erythritol kinase [uncultured Alphaproteobacteria bacterium]